MSQPDSAALRKFLDVFRRLETFEATQRFTHGHGAFKANECPMPEVISVVSWLDNLTKSDGKNGRIA